MYITYNAFVLKYFLHIHVCHSVVFTCPDVLAQETREEEKWDVFQDGERKKERKETEPKGCFIKGAPIVFFLFYIFHNPRV